MTHRDNETPGRVEDGAGTHTDRSDIDRRWSSRKPLRLDVLVYRDRVPVAVGTTRNIGLEGMFLETGRQRFSNQTLLEVAFPVKVDREEQRFRVPAVVVNASTAGMGLTFTAFDQKLFRALERLLYRAGSAEAS